MKILKIFGIVLVTFLITSCENDDDATPTPIIDLEAERISFSLETLTEFTGNATITGTVTNIGDNFSSGTGQQAILLYEKPLGASSLLPEHLVATLEFVNLGANESLNVSYTRFWSRSEEFPPDYVLVISYDPDLFLDGNESNDDTNHDNNSVTESGFAIHDLF